MDFKNIPKVELHRHLDASVRFETIVELAKKNKIDLGPYSQDDLFKKVKILSPLTDLKSVIDVFWITQKVLCNYEAIKRIAYENVQDQMNDGVVLGELRFAPNFIAENKELEYDEILEAVLDGVAVASKKFNIPIGLIHIAARALDLKKNFESADASFKYKSLNKKNSEFLIGFDLADMETGVDPTNFISLIDKARESGLEITIHSGEDSSAEAMWKTIEYFNPKRIGHGIRCVHDSKLMSYLKENEIHLEVCPTSNYLVQCCPILKEHPLKKIFDFGISCSINSDDPHAMNIDLVHEYKICQEYFGFTESDFFKINLNSLHHSFLPTEIKNEVRRKYFFQQP